MNPTYFLLVLSFLLSSCFAHKPLVKNFESEHLKIKSIGENVWVHISYLETDDFGKVACNGMVYFNENEAIVFDTPTENRDSKTLIDWIEKEQKKKIKAVVVTHFHVDCLGGLQAFHDAGITSYATQQTIELARQNNRAALPKNGFDTNKKFQIGRQSVFATFYGEGHTKDNIVGYIPEVEALFGGCLIKSENASKGNLADANVAQWPTTVQRIKKEIPNLKIVIPGHGQFGGTSLLDYTIELFEEAN